jgi:hypothetical protein
MARKMKHICQRWSQIDSWKRPRLKTRLCLFALIIGSRGGASLADISLPPSRGEVGVRGIRRPMASPSKTFRRVTAGSTASSVNRTAVLSSRGRGDYLGAIRG